MRGSLNVGLAVENPLACALAWDSQALPLTVTAFPFTLIPFTKTDPGVGLGVGDGVAAGVAVGIGVGVGAGVGVGVEEGVGVGVGAGVGVGLAVAPAVQISIP